MNIRIRIGGEELVEITREPMSEDARETLFAVIALLIICGLFVFGICMMMR